MAWNRSPHAGFSNVEPWLPLHVDWPVRNVEAENANHGSMLSLYRELLNIRRSEPALSIGSIELVDSEPDVIAFRRSHADRRLFIALNLSSERRVVALPPGELILSTIDLGSFDGSLRGNEGVILRMAD